MKTILNLLISVPASGNWRQKEDAVEFCKCKANGISGQSERVWGWTSPGIILIRRWIVDVLLMSARNLNKSSSLSRSPSWEQAQTARLNRSLHQYTKNWVWVGAYTGDLLQYLRSKVMHILGMNMLASVFWRNASVHFTPLGSLKLTFV